MEWEEINFDGMVGPTHHYGGYAYGNLASMEHRLEVSHPRAAALQGLRKMKFLADLGVPQAVLPPRMRPAIGILRRLGFEGNDRAVFEKAATTSPLLVQQLSSAASMWAANCATVSPSCDSEDGKVHLSIANLQSQFHRTVEAEESYRLFRILFPDESLFVVHPPLPHGGNFGDEGAANHTRFCSDYGMGGTHLFVYGRSAFDPTQHHFPFRQAREASEAIARQNRLPPQRVIFAMQNPEIIEKGVFHNDVISVGNRNHFFYHEKAFVETEKVLVEINEKSPLQTICVTEEMIPVEKAVNSYLFNSQIVTLPNGEDVLIAPRECESLFLEWLPLPVYFVDVRESMRNGGGPACLRLRIVLNSEEKSRVHPSIRLDETLYQSLVGWIERYYRESLTAADLLDPLFFDEVKQSLDALTQILQLGSFYEFQRNGSSPA